MATKEITYPSLQAILEYMDPILRFRLADRIPCIRTAEKGTPLRLKYLMLDTNSIYINDTKYTIECVQYFAGKPINPEERSIVPYDLDEYGSRDWSAEDQIYPGDIVISDEYEVRSMPVLRPYYQEGPTYETRLRLTIKTSSEIFTEFLTHDRKIPEAMKYLSNKLLGGRRPHVQTADLLFGNSGILRLPVNLKIEVKELEIWENVAEIMDATQDLFHWKSFPLNLVGIETASLLVNPENFNHHTVQSAKLVVMRYEEEPIFWDDVLPKMKSSHVIFQCLVSHTEILALIDSWRIEGRKIGTEYRFDFEYLDEVMLLFETLKEYPTVIVDELVSGYATITDFIIFPLNGSSEIVIYCDDYVNYNEAPYVLILIVAPIHHRYFMNIDFYDVNL